MKNCFQYLSPYLFYEAKCRIKISDRVVSDYAADANIVIIVENDIVIEATMQTMEA